MIKKKFQICVNSHEIWCKLFFWDRDNIHILHFVKIGSDLDVAAVGRNPNNIYKFKHFFIYDILYILFRLNSFVNIQIFIDRSMYPNC